MIDVPVHWEESRWQWAAYSDNVAGPAGVVTLKLSATCTLHVDACTGVLLGITFVGNGRESTLRIERPTDLYHRFTSSWRDGEVATTDADTAALLARYALGADACHRSHGTNPTPAWTNELNAIAALLRSDAPVPTFERATADARAVDAATLRDAQQRFTELPLHVGRLGADGPVWVDASWCGNRVLDLRTLYARRDANGGVIELSAEVMTEVYAPEARRILAVLVDERDDVVVAVAGFATIGRVRASAHLIVSPERDLSSLTLVVLNDPSNRPTRAERVRAVAIDLGRRSAQAGRIGLTERSAALHTHSLELWDSLGSHPTPDPIPSIMAVPFIGEIADLIDRRAPS
jgi:hypothetical protein